jgi:guanylate kinase
MARERYLGIVGPSGVGKTTLMMKLIEDYPSIFFKVNQCTTREIRDDETGDAYIWLDSKRDYRKIEHLLIAKTEVRGSLYGSIPEARDSMVGVIILNEKGLLDLVNQSNLTRNNYYIIGLNKPIEEIEAKRDGRPDDYLIQEREVLKYADTVIDVSNNRYAKTENVMRIARDFFNGEEL